LFRSRRRPFESANFPESASPFTSYKSLSEASDSGSRSRRGPPWRQRSASPVGVLRKTSHVPGAGESLSGTRRVTTLPVRWPVSASIRITTGAAPGGAPTAAPSATGRFKPSEAARRFKNIRRQDKEGTGGFMMARSKHWRHAPASPKTRTYGVWIQGKGPMAFVGWV